MGPNALGWRMNRHTCCHTCIRLTLLYCFYPFQQLNSISNLPHFTHPSILIFHTIWCGWFDLWDVSCVVDWSCCWLVVWFFTEVCSSRFFLICFTSYLLHFLSASLPALLTSPTALFPISYSITGVVDWLIGGMVSWLCCFFVLMGFSTPSTQCPLPLSLPLF